MPDRAPLALAPADWMPGEDPAKVAAALARFRPRVATSLDDFDLAYRLLDAQFGAAGELERREVLERWFTGGRASARAFEARYHVLLVDDADGRVAAVRDAFTAYDPVARRVVALLSHSLVLPTWRRTGVAAILRASPVAFAREHARAHGVDDADLLLIAEMEPVDPVDRDTLVRLVAYVRAGFRVLSPTRVPYAQPDFRDLAMLGEPARPLPLLLLVRHVGHDDATALSWARVQAIFDGLRAIHAPTAGPDQLDAIRAIALAGRGRPEDTVPLLVPDLATADGLAPLLRSVLAAHYPPSWVGDRPASDPEADRRALQHLLEELT